MDFTGVSFVICSHNGASRLPVALKHLAGQIVNDQFPWEIVLVDNASTDNTVAVAGEVWSNYKSPAELRIVHEPNLGIANARYRGIQEARFEFISFVDDDNWLEPDYAEVAFDTMIRNPKIGACGSLNEAVAERRLPSWFENFHRSYAVGPQADTIGDITWERGVLWSAGMVLRKSAITRLLENGFRPLVTGAIGEKKLLRCEDYELCLALRLAGWAIWYEPRLRLKHFMPSQRLNWKYLRRLLRGVGQSSIGLDVYYQAASKAKITPFRFRIYSSWYYKTCYEAYVLFERVIKLFISSARNGEGNALVLDTEFSFGRFMALLSKRKFYHDAQKLVLNSKWLYQDLTSENK